MRPEADPRRSLSGGTKLLLVLVAIIAIPVLMPAGAAFGWQEIGLVLLALLLLTWPALAFYAWAKRRGDL